MQRLDSYSAAYCFLKTYLTKVFGMDFEPAILNLYYQTIS